LPSLSLLSTVPSHTASSFSLRHVVLMPLLPVAACFRLRICAVEVAPPSSSHGGVDAIDAWQRRQQRRLPRRGAAGRSSSSVSASGACTWTAKGSRRSIRAIRRRLLRREAATVEAARCCVKSFLPTKTTSPTPPTPPTMAEVQPRRNKMPPPRVRPTAILAVLLLSPPQPDGGVRRRTVLEDYN
jgi:hypothetical protein